MSSLSNFHQPISVGDVVMVIGRDSCKGLIGTITSQKQSTGEILFTIELDANHKEIERGQPNIRKYVRSTTSF